MTFAIRKFLAASLLVSVASAQAQEISKTQSAKPGASWAVTQAKSIMVQLVEVANHARATNGVVSPESQLKVKAVSKQIDFEALSQKALGAKWKTFPAAQRKQFLATLQELLEIVAYPQATKIAVKPDDLKYEAMPGKNNEVKATGQVEREKRGERVTQDVETVIVFDAKTQRLVDLVVEGEKISANLNRQFTAALKKKTFAQIIEQMQKRVNEAKASPTKATQGSTPSAAAQGSTPPKATE